ncbi:ACP S-malonyltransferase [Paractinoplanes abujensis]|uniref:[acyl-carrier-protein] S-malonyltransferase n=1 Tax=Paractinoplanes abujensis TaxID=882441 RepID=A0A7W7CQV5_9ACTN|nr:ACP S-malonyltransferase [Actinoplanes abujensis]MBB4693045.1 [acyl-carrier-protein] S-malonyltransferase [Actinoplanes abujensis]
MLTNSFARRRIAEADEVLGYPLVRRYRETDGEYTEYAQVAFLVNCLALADWNAAQQDEAPVAVTGPSFGGKAAAVWAGSLAFADAVRMTAGFARLMTDYFSTHHTDVVTQSFARTPPERLREVLAELDEAGEWYDISCYVDDDFTMLSLRESRLGWLERRLRAVGGLPLYTLRPPMHSSAFGELRRRAEAEVVGGMAFADPRIPLVADLDGAVMTTAAQVRQLLLDGFVRPVRWPAVVATLRGLSVGTLHVAGADSLFTRVPITTNTFAVAGVNPRTAMQPRRRVAV